MKAEVYHLFKKIEAEFPLPDSFDAVLTSTILWYAHGKSIIDMHELLQNDTLSDEAYSAAIQSIETEWPELQGVFQELSSLSTLGSEKSKNLLTALQTLNTTSIEISEWTEELIAASPFRQDSSSGENASPVTLNELAVSLLSPVSGSFYDGTAGLGGSLVTAARYSHDHGGSLDIYGQELNRYNWAVARIRLFLNGIPTTNFFTGDSLVQPAHTDNGEMKRFDYVFLDGPFGSQIRDYELVKSDPYRQFSYGPLTKKSGDMALLMHTVSSLNYTGKAVMTVTDGVLYRGGTEQEIRKNILEKDIIEAIISLPQKLYEKTAVPINLILLNRAKPKERKGKVLFVNAENLYTKLTKSRRLLSDTHIAEITGTVQKGKQTKETSGFVKLSDIKEGNLLPSRYLTPDTLEISDYGKVQINPEELEKIETINLKDIADFFPGFNILSKHKESSDGEHRIVKLSDVQDGKIDTGSVSRYHIPGNAQLHKYELQEGDVILAIRGNSLKTAVIPQHDGTLLLSQNFIGIRCSGQLDPHYLKMYLDSPPGQYLLRSKLSGTTVLTLNKKDVQNLAIPKKQISEQRSIIKRYQEKEAAIAEQIFRLKEEQKKIKLNLYQEVGIRHSFEMKS